jgi:hypothetical protein
MEFFRRARARRVGEPGSAKTHLIGGQVDLTIVDAAGARSTTIHRWNDTIGELIDPSKDQPSAKVVPIAVGMNRQQRRAAERAARKGRAA